LRGDIFLNFHHTELKSSSEINFSVVERHRWAVVGQAESLDRRIGSVSTHRLANLHSRQNSILTFTTLKKGGEKISIFFCLGYEKRIFD